MSNSKKKKATQDPPPTVFNAVLEHDEVARLAYSYWEERGYQDGCPQEDWLRAEAELRQRLENHRAASASA